MLFGVCSGVAVGVCVGVHVGVGAGMRPIEPALPGGVCCAAVRWRGLRIPDACSERGGDAEEDLLQSPGSKGLHARVGPASEARTAAEQE